MLCPRLSLLPCLILILVARAGADEAIGIRHQEGATVLQGPAFGTTFTIKVADELDEQQARLLAANISRTIDDLNQQMSLWDEDSELTRFNAAPGGTWTPVSADFVRVVEAALTFREQTLGSFDPTVRPLLKLWTFGPGQRPRQIPEDGQIAAAREFVGADIRTSSEADELTSPAVWKSDENVELDLNAIAKGFAVDKIADVIADTSSAGFMVEVGGEVRTHGTRADGSPWRIAIEQPVAGSRSISSYVELHDASLATSGDYRNYFEADGQRFSHTIDPRTGRPIKHTLASVSVIADDCMTADAWATALMVLGPDEGYNLARQEQISALFLVRDGESFVSRATSEFPEVIALVPQMTGLSPWSTYLLTAAVFGIAVVAMAIGVILSNRRLRGSCGGLNGLKDERGNSLCEACTTPPEQCDEFRKQVASATRSPSE